MPGLEIIRLQVPKLDSADMAVLQWILSPSITKIEFEGESCLLTNVFTLYTLPLVCHSASYLRTLSILRSGSGHQSAAWDTLPAPLMRMSSLQSLTLRFPEDTPITPTFLIQLIQSARHLTSLTLDVHCPRHASSIDDPGQSLPSGLKKLHLVCRSGFTVCPCYPPLPFTTGDLHHIRARDLNHRFECLFWRSTDPPVYSSPPRTRDQCTAAQRAPSSHSGARGVS